MWRTQWGDRKMSSWPSVVPCSLVVHCNKLLRNFLLQPVPSVHNTTDWSGLEETSNIIKFQPPAMGRDEFSDRGLWLWWCPTFLHKMKTSLSNTLVFSEAECEFLGSYHLRCQSFKPEDNHEGPIELLVCDMFTFGPPSPLRRLQGAGTVWGCVCVSINWELTSRWHSEMFGTFGLHRGQCNLIF